MSADFYTLRKKAVKVFCVNGGTMSANFLQKVIGNALSPDAQGIVDSAIKSAFKEWESSQELPKLVVQVGINGIPEAGSPIFTWGINRRVYCFDDELLEPFGYLGEREFAGFRFRSIKEQEYANDLATARGIDEGRAKVYKDFWAGETFQTGSEFLAYRRGRFHSSEGRPVQKRSSTAMVSPKLVKIVHLIRFIESKGESASTADLHFLDCLRDKAVQLGYTFH